MNLDPAARRLKLQRYGKIMEHACAALAFTLPVFVIVALVKMSPAAIVAVVSGSSDLPVADFPPLNLFGIVFTLTLPALILAYGLWRMRLAFLAISGGVYFAPIVFNPIRDFAAMLLASSVLQIIAIPVTGFLAVLGTGSHGSISLRFDSPEILRIAIAAGLWILSWLLAEAADMAEDQAQIV